MPHSLEETGVCAAGYFCELGSNTPTPNGINNTGVAGKCKYRYVFIDGSCRVTLVVDFVFLPQNFGRW